MSADKTDGEQRRKRRRAWGKFFTYISLLLTGLLVGGFISFAYTVENEMPPHTLPNADGIVVWTGKGGGRLSAGADLLKKGHGERLLISGVNESNSREDVLALLDLPENLSVCCVDLDYAARDTIGNARETSNWSEALGYEHIILVTSDYHMPRARIEISAARGRINITPYPVTSESDGIWWKDNRKLRRYAQEYGKLLLTYVRRSGSTSGRGTPMLSDVPQVETSNIDSE